MKIGNRRITECNSKVQAKSSSYFQYHLENCLQDIQHPSLDE